MDIAWNRAGVGGKRWAPLAPNGKVGATPARTSGRSRKEKVPSGPAIEPWPEDRRAAGAIRDPFAPPTPQRGALVSDMPLGLKLVAVGVAYPQAEP